jgi:host factor-I protein
VNRPAHPLQDQFLQHLCDEKTFVSVFLLNGIRLLGEIAHFDRYSVTVRGTSTQLIYKHAISTVVPTPRASAYPDAGDTPGGERKVIVRKKVSRAMSIKPD